ncbi:MAG: hypothetical protein QOD72_2904 [Acidimicrobiaceae bacterium]|jgi:hypothetical protein|nr:hypothetical protein [Acidimicrobiaceae bacterium]
MFESAGDESSWSEACEERASALLLFRLLGGVRTTQLLRRNQYTALRGSAPIAARFDVPRWSEPKVHRDFHVEVDRALYSRLGSSRPADAPLTLKPSTSIWCRAYWNTPAKTRSPTPDPISLQGRFFRDP